METYLKFLIAAAVAVPIFVELRTFGGMLFGYEVPLLVSVVVGIIVAALVVFVDENVSFGDRSMSL
jgi:hypothetical protein